MLINAFHAALEHGKETFDSISVQSVIQLGNVLADAMTHEAMIPEVYTDMGVLPRLVSQDACFTVDVSPKDRKNGLGLEIVHNDAPGAVVRSTRDRTLFLCS